MKRIEILISPTGTSTIQTKGFSGASCQQASQFLEQALGMTLTTERTAEFYQSQTNEQSQHQHL